MLHQRITGTCRSRSSIKFVLMKDYVLHGICWYFVLFNFQLNIYYTNLSFKSDKSRNKKVFLVQKLFEVLEDYPNCKFKFSLVLTSFSNLMDGRTYPFSGSSVVT